MSQFVDDSATLLTASRPKLAVKKAKKILDAIETWSHDFGFIINPSKSQVLIIHKPTAKFPDNSIPALALGGQTLDHTCKTTATFLEMTFDKTLSWKTHIRKLIDRCNRDLNIIQCTKDKNWGTDKRAHIYT